MKPFSGQGAHRTEYASMIAKLRAIVTHDDARTILFAVKDANVWRF